MIFTKIYDEEEILKFIYNNYDKMSQFEIADYFGCSRSTINLICMKYDIRKHKIHYIPLENEILKPMKEYDYLYGITNKGRVVNLITNTVLTNKVSNGYWYTTIQINKKIYNIRIHRMIAIYFVKGRTKEMDCVNHIDGNKLNNSLDNLEWVNVTINNYHMHEYGLVKRGSECKQSKINEEIAMKIYNEHHINGLSYNQIRDKYNISKTIIGKVCRKERWKHIHKDYKYDKYSEVQRLSKR